MPNTEDLAAEQTRKQRRVHVLVILVDTFKVIGIAVSLIVLLLQSARISAISENNQELNRHTLENSRLLIDCTTPGYPCYERSRGETGKAVVILNDVTKAASVCADKPGTISYAEMDACIKFELTKIK